MDIRMTEALFEFGGKPYKLRCNMSAIADVQEAYDGNLALALGEKTSLRSKLIFLAAMMNDWADQQGWPERVTWRELGRHIHLQDAVLMDVARLVATEILRPASESAETPEPEDATEKN